VPLLQKPIHLGLRHFVIQVVRFSIEQLLRPSDAGYLEGILVFWDSILRKPAANFHFRELVLGKRL
jgi:hypothetical protein